MLPSEGGKLGEGKAEEAVDCEGERAGELGAASSSAQAVEQYTDDGAQGFAPHWRQRSSSNIGASVGSARIFSGLALCTFASLCARVIIRAWAATPFTSGAPGSRPSCGSHTATVTFLFPFTPFVPQRLSVPTLYLHPPHGMRSLAVLLVFHPCSYSPSFPRTPRKEQERENKERIRK